MSLFKRINAKTNKIIKKGIDINAIRVYSEHIETQNAFRKEHKQQMAKALKNIFPGLRAKMSYANEDARDLADLLDMSDDSVRRRLSGRADFELTELKKLIEHYSSSFEELFEKVDA